MTNCRLSLKGLALSLGIVSGLAVPLLEWLAWNLIYTKTYFVALSAMYMGYEPTLKDSVIDGLSALVIGGIIGAVIATLYNIFSGPCACCTNNNLTSSSP